MAAQQPVQQDNVIPPPADPFGQDGVKYCLQTCGFTQSIQRQGWIDEGMSTMAHICTFRPKEIYEVGANLQKLSLNRGGSRQGRVQLKKLKALVRWCLERRSSGLNLDANEFTFDVMMEIVENIRLEKEVEDQGEEIAMDPESTMPEVDEVTPDSYDTYLGAKLLLPVILVVVRQRVRVRI